MKNITVVNDLNNDKEASSLGTKLSPILEYALSLQAMSDNKLANEYMALLAGKKTEIDRTLIKHEMSKRFFKQWAKNALK